MRDPDERLDQLRHLPRDDPRREDARLLHLARQARPHRCATNTRRAASGCRSRSCVGGDPMSFLMASSEVPYGVCELRDRRRHARRAGRGDQGAGHRPADSRQRRDRDRRIRRARQRAAGRAVRRMDRLLRQRRASGAGDRHQGDLSPQRADPARLRAAAAARRDLPLSRHRALGARCARTSTRPACPTSPRRGRTRSATRACCSAVAIKQRYPGHAKQAGHIAAQCHVGAYCGRYVIVVDDDIDVSNLEELIWALITRSDPATSIDIIHGAWSTPLDPRIEPERKAAGDLHQQPRRSSTPAGRGTGATNSRR